MIAKKQSLNHLLPYQVKWILDESPLKIWEKTRRGGMTWTVALECVFAGIAAKNPVNTWFSSADESAAREFIKDVEYWLKFLKHIADFHDEKIIEGDKEITVFTVKFATGKTITAMSSNPSRYRSKMRRGDMVVADEFAIRDDQEAVWAAISAALVWKGRIIILSTYNGKSNLFYKLVDEARGGLNEFSLHSTNIVQAVEQGLADKVEGRKLTQQERAEWLEKLRKMVGNDDVWNQEFLCIPAESVGSWLTWDLIVGMEHEKAGMPKLYEGGKCYVGMDIGRRRDLTVIWVVELVGDVFWNREVVSLSKQTFERQEFEFDKIMKKYDVVRACVDQTGMGEPVVERLRNKYGWKVEGILFNTTVKQDMAMQIKRLAEDKRLRIPKSDDIRAAHQAVKRIVTAANNIRFDAENTFNGHADEFWAHCLALHAASTNTPPAFVSVDDPKLIQSTYQTEARGFLGNLRQRLRLP